MKKGFEKNNFSRSDQFFCTIFVLWADLRVLKIIRYFKSIQFWKPEVISCPNNVSYFPSHDYKFLKMLFKKNNFVWMTQFLEHFFVVRTFLGCSSEQGDFFTHIWSSITSASYQAQTNMCGCLGCWEPGTLSNLYILFILLPHWPVREFWPTRRQYCFPLANRKPGISHMTKT